MRLLDLIYSPRCLCCFQVISIGKQVCDSCSKDFWQSKNDIEYHTPLYDCVSLFRYTETIRKMVNNIKFKKSMRICKRAGALLADEAEKISKRYRIDEVVYVPMTKTDFRERGFNQSEVFAKIVSKRLGLDFKKNAILKTKQTEHQKNLPRSQRLKNLKGAFKAVRDLDGKNILLIDDITTTGSTLTEVSKQLYKAGAIRVVALTLAKAGGT